ncbi:unnamed protein product [Cylicocyclus nassatus]|uniref:Uncharacterized protein n=1 Tax=Cylicocyclus nassatus TaxID=53992 RepID=A0AA36DRY9_CYLNA|nr:unnamed protein product [Cylicocyclus nassatus]
MLFYCVLVLLPAFCDSLPRLYDNKRPEHEWNIYYNKLSAWGDNLRAGFSTFCSEKEKGNQLNQLQYVSAGEYCRKFKDAVYNREPLKGGVMYDFNVIYIEKNGTVSQYMAEEFAYWMMEDPRYKKRFRDKKALFEVGLRVVY